MRHGRPGARQGASPADMLVFLATLSVAVALLYPAWSVRDSRAQIESAVADVETVLAAAREVREATNRWPTSAPPGEAPPELAALRGDGSVFARSAYTLGWTSWDVVDSVVAAPAEDPTPADDAPRVDAAPRMEPVVRRVGAVTIHTAEEHLLAELLSRYPDGESFVLDTMWLLMLPERAAPPLGR